MNVTEALTSIRRYHQQTKHHPSRYARGPGQLDWINQPAPFREFVGAPAIDLPLVHPDDSPLFVDTMAGRSLPVRPLDLVTLGRFLEGSLGLAAWKQAGSSRWALRINPSSGNLHPTEAYLVLPPVAGRSDLAGVHHYLSRDHRLEQRARASPDSMPSGGFWVALSTIPWREAWKYGERAFRYCQHDIGHALAALRISAQALGWTMHLVWDWTEPALTRLLGLDRASDFIADEPEHAEVLAWIAVNGQPPPRTLLDLPCQWFGQANRLSHGHVAWPIIEEAMAASAWPGFAAASGATIIEPAVAWGDLRPPSTRLTTDRIVRQRRSAVDFDGHTRLPLDQFLAILDLTLPRATEPPFDLGLGPPRVHLILFVHRVDGLDSGLYAWVRQPSDLPCLKAAMQSPFEWHPVVSMPERVPLYRLQTAKTQDFARTISCHQDIAADGAFSLGMLAAFDPVLDRHGPALYRHLFWETGLIGQMLYLGAEAAGVRGTGIGCFHDDLMHRALGLTDCAWQSLYHFTIGTPVEDPRLITLPPYAHLAGRGREFGRQE
jgi:SagB-type dehydrogenase family enzyme